MSLGKIRARAKSDKTHFNVILSCCAKLFQKSQNLRTGHVLEYLLPLYKLKMGANFNTQVKSFKKAVKGAEQPIRNALC